MPNHHVVNVVAAITLITSTLFATTFIVAKDGSGQFTSIQAAINTAGPGDEVIIKDATVYEEQVTIDSTKNGLTLRSEDPRTNKNKPTIKYQDRTNVGPKDGDEALIDSLITFDRNGALQVLGAAEVRIEGIIIDGGGNYPFGYDAVWEGRYALQHGNAAITLWISGDVIVRDCDIRNAYFGIYFKDRNEGGIFANRNPADINPDNPIPFSGFARTGNHLIEYNRIHDNSVGMFFESTWDLGSTIRYNLIYENHHPTAEMANKVNTLTSEGGNQAGGAFMFKDHLLSPLSIYNNTLWHNSLVFLGNWKAGGQHLIFNNIYGSPNEYWMGSRTTFSVSFEMSNCFTNRMHNCVYSAQVDPPQANNVRITNDLRPAQTGGTYEEGTLITPFPSSADIRWVEMDDTRFLSIDPTSAEFLTPNWADEMVSTYIIDNGWEESGVRDLDGTRADLGAIPSSGGRRPVDVMTIRPTMPAVCTENDATIGFTVTPRIGTVSNMRLTMLGLVKDLDTSDCFANAYKAISASNISIIAIPAKQIVLGANSIEVPLPSGGIGDFAFFEMFVDGTGSDGIRFASAAGFIPYRKLDNNIDVSILDKVGGSPINLLQAGQTVALNVEARRGDSVFTSTIDPTEVNLQSRFVIYDPAGTPVTTIPGGITGTSSVDVVFTRVPPGGTEYVFVSGRWIDDNKVIPFLGTSQGVRILPGPAESISFQQPASGMTEIVDPGTTFPVKVQAFDMYGNRTHSASIKCVSIKPAIGIIVDSIKTTDTTGIAACHAIVTNGDSGMVFPVVATLASKPTAVDTAYLKVGSPRVSVTPPRAISIKPGEFLCELIDLHGRVVKQIVTHSSFSAGGVGSPLAVKVGRGIYLLKTTDIGSGKVSMRRRVVLGR